MMMMMMMNLVAPAACGREGTRYCSTSSRTSIHPSGSLIPSAAEPGAAVAAAAEARTVASNPTINLEVKWLELL